MTSVRLDTKEPTEEAVRYGYVIFLDTIEIVNPVFSRSYGFCMGRVLTIKGGEFVETVRGSIPERRCSPVPEGERTGIV